MNTVTFTSYTGFDISDANHSTVQECDARNDEECYKAWSKNI